GSPRPSARGDAGGRRVYPTERRTPPSDGRGMSVNLPPLDDVLGRLPWFSDLSQDHRGELLAEIARRLAVETSRAEFTALLLQWADVAHIDAQWRRFEQLRQSGILRPPDRAPGSEGPYTQ